MELSVEIQLLKPRPFRCLMIFSIKSILICFLFFTVSYGYGQVVTENKVNYLEFNSAKELHDFFSYKKGNPPLISGHRGGMEPGYPENSIEAFEHVLKNTPAIFEIDPRMTKDSVVVLMHDASLERTTNGSGNLIELTWEDASKLFLKDVNGKLTSFKIPTLEEAISWSKDKTILNLDHKNVPLQVTADLIKRLDAFDHVMITVHKPSEARYYLDQHPDFMFSAFIRTVEEFEAYEEAKIPWTQIMAYVGSLSKAENKNLYDMLHSKGVKVMVSAAPSYDKMERGDTQDEAYRQVFLDGADVLESDYPIRVSKAILHLDQ